MSEKMKWLEKYAPLGMKVNTPIGWFVAGNVVATLHSLLFLVNYSRARSVLYMKKGTDMILIEGAMIKDFDWLTGNLFLTFYVVEIVTLASVILYYLYHYDGSKMMYLMRRLPDKTEVVRRCWTLPIAGFCITLVWSLILRLIYYMIYICCTPSQCLPL